MRFFAVKEIAYRVKPPSDWDVVKPEAIKGIIVGNPGGNWEILWLEDQGQGDPVFNANHTLITIEVDDVDLEHKVNRP